MTFGAHLTPLGRPSVTLGTLWTNFVSIKSPKATQSASGGWKNSFRIVSHPVLVVVVVVDVVVVPLVVAVFVVVVVVAVVFVSGGCRWS